MKRTALFILTLAASATLASLAGIGASHAHDGIDKGKAAAFDNRMFAGSLGQKTYACFVRRYDASHLAEHPKQKVSYCNHVVAEDKGNEIRYGCGIDCDGGGIDVAMKDDKSAIIRLERITVWERNKPDDDASDALLAGADDKIFRVDRADLRECAELVTDRKELAALRHK